MEISHENQDALVNFMQPKDPARSYSWLRLWSECWIPVNHMLCTIEDLLTFTGHQYKLNEKTNRWIMINWKG